jgi:hypothetical protein
MQGFSVSSRQSAGSRKPRGALGATAGPISPVGSSPRNGTSNTSSRGQGGADHRRFPPEKPRSFPARVQPQIERRFFPGTARAGVGAIERLPPNPRPHARSARIYVGFSKNLRRFLSATGPQPPRHRTPHMRRLSPPRNLENENGDGSDFSAGKGSSPVADESRKCVHQKSLPSPFSDFSPTAHRRSAGPPRRRPRPRRWCR